MAYYPDLSQYSYHSQDIDSSTLNVGWLNKAHDFRTGEVSALFVTQLRKFCCTPVLQMRGFHACELCTTSSLNEQQITCDNEKRWLGSAEIRVFSREGVVYAVPDLIYHYVVKHAYHPPEQFIQAVLEGAQPDTPEYWGLIKPWVSPYSS